MTSLDPGRTILVNVDDAAAARVVGAILQALGDDYEFFLLFSEPGLKDVLGDTRHPYGFDAQACLLNPEHFGLVLTFGSLFGGGTTTDSAWLARYFEEIGVPTIEVQRNLFQEGCYPLSRETQRSGVLRSSEGATVLWRYASPTLLEWGGPNGIGYPRAHSEDDQSSLARPRARFDLPVRTDLVSVTSSLEHSANSERDCYRFTIAVLKLAMAHPELSFCWAIRAEEQRSKTAVPFLQMVSEGALPNLWLESAESPLSVIKRSRFGIAMPSTALLDYQSASKPVLLQAGQLRSALGDGVSAPAFQNYFELEEQLAKLLAEPKHFLLSLSVGELQPERLRAAIDSSLARAKLAPEWFEVASRYSLQFRVSAVQEQSEKLRARFDAASLDQNADKLAKVLERLTVIQRSTVGYKTLQLVNRLKGKGRPR